MAHAAYTAYRNTSIQTASREQLVIMLYDGLLRFMNIAKASIASQQMYQAHTCLMKSQDIVTELRDTLDMQYEISHALAQLYDYFLRKLVEANMSKTVDPIEEIEPRVMELRDAWAQAAAIVRMERGQESGE